MMKNKSKAYISIYALSMFLVLVLAISFLIILNQNKRIENRYYENKIHARTWAYSISSFLVTDKDFIDTLNSKTTYRVFQIPQLNRSVRVNFTRYDNKIYRANYNIEYPKNDKYSSMANCKIDYVKKSFFDHNVVDRKKIDEAIERFGKDKSKINIDELVLFSFDKKTYFNSLENINQIYKKWQEENADKISGRADLKPSPDIFVSGSTELKDSAIIDSKKIILLNDVDTRGIFVDRDNIYKLDIISDEAKRVRVNGILLMIDSDNEIYDVTGNYLTTKELSKSPNLKKNDIKGEYDFVLKSVRII
ncbi:MAG: hypothetical protein SPI59_02035 [Finegoldia sp.]|nr:hypothetical protein [Finegoldia sp.]